MPISVTSSESSETTITYVNGLPYSRTEVTKIYVIEPHESTPSRAISSEEQTQRLLEEKIKQLGSGETRIWRIGAIVAIWIVWGAYVYHEYMKVCSLSQLRTGESERGQLMQIVINANFQAPEYISRDRQANSHSPSYLSFGVRRHHKHHEPDSITTPSSNTITSIDK